MPITPALPKSSSKWTERWEMEGEYMGEICGSQIILSFFWTQYWFFIRKMNVVFDTLKCELRVILWSSIHGTFIHNIYLYMNIFSYTIFALHQWSVLTHYFAMFTSCPLLLLYCPKCTTTLIFTKASCVPDAYFHICATLYVPTHPEFI